MLFLDVGPGSWRSIGSQSQSAADGNAAHGRTTVGSAGSAGRAPWDLRGGSGFNTAPGAGQPLSHLIGGAASYSGSHVAGTGQQEMPSVLSSSAPTTERFWVGGPVPQAFTPPPPLRQRPGTPPAGPTTPLAGGEAAQHNIHMLGLYYVRVQIGSFFTHKTPAHSVLCCCAASLHLSSLILPRACILTSFCSSLDPPLGLHSSPCTKQSAFQGSLHTRSPTHHMPFNEQLPAAC